MPLNTPAFSCTGCGAVALNADSLCQPAGRVRKSDWCGTESIDMPPFCLNDRHTLRYRCKKCGRISIDAPLLCEPEKVPVKE